MKKGPVKGPFFMKINKKNLFMFKNYRDFVKNKLEEDTFSDRVNKKFFAKIKNKEDKVSLDPDENTASFTNSAFQDDDEGAD